MFLKISVSQPDEFPLGYISPQTGNPLLENLELAAVGNRSLLRAIEMKPRLLSTARGVLLWTCATITVLPDLCPQDRGWGSMTLEYLRARGNQVQLRVVMQSVPVLGGPDENCAWWRLNL